MNKAINTSWIPVVGYEHAYEVSIHGEVRRIGGLYVGQFKNSGGYLLVRLSGPRKTLRVHRIVAAAFLDNKDGKPFVNHIDCEKTNNKVSNLEWCTQKENIIHSKNLGRMQSNYWVGKRSPYAKLKDEIADQIRSEYSVGDSSFSSLALKYGTSKRTVGRILAGESYV